MGRVFLGLIAHELRRGRTLILVLVGASVVGLVPALLLDGVAAVLPTVLVLLLGLGAVLGPVGDLLQDRIQGHLEAERMLPWPRRLLAAGRLAGASCRVLPAALTVIPLGLAIARLDTDAEPGLAIALILVPVAVLCWVVASIAAWVLMALNARWQLRRLWWIPFTLWMLPGVLLEALPEETKRALEAWLEPRVDQLLAVLATPEGMAAAAVLALAALAIVFSGAAWLYATGLDRFRADTSGIGEDLGRAPRHELGSAGRGVALAIARLRLRVASEQMRREGIVLLVLFAVIAFGGGGLRRYAQTYLPVLATLIPGGIVAQLMLMRATGDLEALQQLPHPAWRVALGHLLAVAILAVPGALVIHAGRAIDGRSVTALAIVASWCWFTAGTWVAAATGLFVRRKHVAVLAAVGVAVALWGVAGDGLDLAAIGPVIERLRDLRATWGVLLPITAALLATAIGIPLFARGLTRYRKA